MAIVVSCVCGRVYRLHPSKQGRKFECDECGAVFVAGSGRRPDRREPRGSRDSGGSAVPVVPILVGGGLFITLLAVVVVVALVWRPSVPTAEAELAARKAELEAQLAEDKARLDDIRRRRQDSQPKVKPQEITVQAPAQAITAPPYRPQPVVKAIAPPLPIQHPTIYQLATSHDGRYVAVRQLSGPISIWDRQGDLNWKTMVSQDNRFDFCGFSPDGSVVMAAGSKGVTLLSHTRGTTGQLVPKQFAKACVLSQDNSLLAVEALAHIHIIDTATANELGKFQISARSFDLASDDKTLIAAEYGAIRVFDATSGEVANWKTSGDLSFSAHAISADGRFVALGTRQGLRLLDVTTGVVFYSDLNPCSNAEIAASRSGNMLVVSRKQGISIFDLSSDRERPQVLEIPASKGTYASPKVALSDDGHWLVANARARETVEIWDLAAMWRAARQADNGSENVGAN